MDGCGFSWRGEEKGIFFSNGLSWVGLGFHPDGFGKVRGLCT